MNFPISKYLQISLLLLYIPAITLSCKKQSDKPTLPSPVKVKVIEVTSGSGSDISQFSGIVTPAETTTISFTVGGTITNLPVKEGQKISKGQLLGKVRNSDYLNAYNIAEAELAEAQDGYNRLKKLHDANVLPDVKWVDIQQKLIQAKNAAEIAKRSLDDANLYSPVAGIVTRKFADVGQTVMPVEPILEVISSDNLTIDISVGENQVSFFSSGQKAQVSVDAFPNESFEGKVTQKSMTADPLTRAFTVKVSIPNKDEKILPGMIGQVCFDRLSNSEELSTSIELPSQAVLLNDDNRWYVWVVVDSMANRRFIVPGDITSTGVKVVSGLQPGDKVIVEGIRKVGTGTRVNF